MFEFSPLFCILRLTLKSTLTTKLTFGSKNTIKMATPAATTNTTITASTATVDNTTTTTSNVTASMNTDSKTSGSNIHGSTNWTKGVKGFLLDVYGVAYNCGEKSSLIEGSVEAVQKLRKADIPFRFCSNTSTKSPEKVLKTLLDFGFDVRPGEIYTPIPVVKDYIRKHGYRPFAMVDPSVDHEFEEFDQTDPDCIVLGDAKHRFSYENLNRAFQILTQKEGSLLVTMGTGKYYKETEGMFLDCGTFAKALEYATDKQCICVGKPAKEYFWSAMESMSLKPHETVMVGDDIIGDVHGAQLAGMKGVQVRTGKYRQSIDEPHNSVTPDAYVDNLLQAVDIYIAEHLKNNL